MNEYKVTAVSHITADSLESAEAEYEASFTPDSHEITLVSDELTDTDNAVLLLCQTLDEVRLEFSNRYDEQATEWELALVEACDLLKTHAGDSDLSGME